MTIIRSYVVPSMHFDILVIQSLTDLLVFNHYNNFCSTQFYFQIISTAMFFHLLFMIFKVFENAILFVIIIIHRNQKIGRYPTS